MEDTSGPDLLRKGACGVCLLCVVLPRTWNTVVELGPWLRRMFSRQLQELDDAKPRTGRYHLLFTDEETEDLIGSVFFTVKELDTQYLQL